MPNLVGAIINIIWHLQKPSMFCVEKFCPDRSKIDADAGAVILMCVEVLTEVVGRHSFHMDSGYVSQYFHIPMVLFAGFHKLRVSRVSSRSTVFSCNEENTSLVGSQSRLYIVDRQFSVELYTSCCRLMCSTIKHQKLYVVLFFLFHSNFSYSAFLVLHLLYFIERIKMILNASIPVGCDV